MENLAENNRLIAEFMEIKPILVSTNFYALQKDHVHITGKNTDIVMFGFSTSAKYHSDWNWLMEVVNEITTEDDFQTDYPDNILFWEAFNQIDLETTYMACIDFIKWHNEQK